MRYALPRVCWQKPTEEACVKSVLASHYPVPLKRIVGPLENQLPHLDEGRIVVSTVIEPLLRALFP